MRGDDGERCKEATDAEVDRVGRSRRRSAYRRFRGSGATEPGQTGKQPPHSGTTSARLDATTDDVQECKGRIPPTRIREEARPERTERPSRAGRAPGTSGSSATPGTSRTSGWV